MMESEPWPSKYQQSVSTTLERTDNLNNGNVHDLNPSEKSQTAGNDDPEIYINGTTQENHTNYPINFVICENAKQSIRAILDEIKALSPNERYLLFLKLPSEVSNIVDPLRQPLNPLGSRSEIYTTISWIKTHLEEDPDVSLPKQQVYDGYSEYCSQIKVKALSQADFGKVMKQVYPKVRARRLGTRGNSRYCYSGLRMCVKLKTPTLPDLSDKPLSTEAPVNQYSITACAWLIVKEWSEQQLGIQFSSLQALACHLVNNHSIGTGTEAASRVTSTTSDSHFNNKSDDNGKCGSKHREMQHLLQKKIQQKNEVNKERKRKMQSPKSGEKNDRTPGKRAKTTTTPNVSRAPSLEISSPGSASTSPTQGKPICDKSLDFTQAPPLPDFANFQRPPAVSPATANHLPQPSPHEQEHAGALASVPPPQVNKVAIPRLPSSTSTACLVSPTRRNSGVGAGGGVSSRNTKYKAIQPKLQQACDIASYNPQPPPQQQAAVAPRSQPQQAQHATTHQANSRIKERRECSNDCDVNPDPDFPITLTRERLDSISNVDKDAMDEYLGTNNSQHEEELSQYFSNDNLNEPTESADKSMKLSQLRKLLQQNGIASSSIPPPPILNVSSSAILTKPIKEEINYQNPVVTQMVTVQNVGCLAPVRQHSNLSNITQSQARRRVSFETHLHDEQVPPSPNTRRKNFSFTPISPGPQSPSGMQSKCSSTNASPFVSPRNTPVARSKIVNHQNMLPVPKKAFKVKKEVDLKVEIPNNESYNLAMSAPASPMLTNGKSMLHKLLNSSSKVSYTPDYNSTQTINFNHGPSSEVAQFIANNHLVESTYRSQSVPLNQMISLRNNVYNINDQFMTLSNQINDFNEIDPIPDSNSDNVNQIISSLDETQPDNNNINLYQDVLNVADNPVNLPPYGLEIINNNIEISDGFTSFNNPMARSMTRSQSMDINIPYESKFNPSRSVPNTPLSFLQQQKQTAIVHPINHSSKSYPSTPLSTKPDPYNYNNINGDCLLNGQPIRTDDLNDGMDFIHFDDRGNVIDHRDDINEGDIAFNIMENTNGLMDENGVLLESNYNTGNIN